MSMLISRGVGRDAMVRLQAQVRNPRRAHDRVGTDAMGLSLGVAELRSC
jgi:hypothetical protein